MAKAKKKTATKAKSKTKSAVKKLKLTSHAVSVTADDVVKSLAWYCDVLGFKIKQKWEHEGTLLGGELVAGGVTFYVGQDDWKKGRDRAKGQGVRLYWYAGTKKNIDSLAAGIKSRGGTLSSEPKDEWGARSFSLEDPSGFLITISSDHK